MAETIRAESLERKERVKQFAIEHMEQTSTFPTARPIQTRFLEKQYPGSLNDISSDLKEVAKDISLVYRSKQSVDIDGDQIEIPKEALEFAVRSYQIIELQQRRKFDVIKQDALVEVDKTRQELTESNGKVIAMETELEAKVSILKIRDKQIQEVNDKLAIQEVELKQAQEKANILEMREEQLQEIKEKLASQEKELKESNSKSRQFELKNNELSTELTATKKHLDDQYKQHENEIKRSDNKLINLQDKVQSLTSVYQSLQIEHKAANSKLSTASEERDAANEDNTTLKSDKIDLNNKISGLTASNNALSDERNIQKEQIHELRDVIQDMTGKIQSFEDKLQNYSGGMQ